MKGALTGLKNLKEVAASVQSSTGGGGFMKLKDGQSVTVRFLQELDTKGKNYDPERGLAVSVFEHSNPENFAQKFLCTMGEEGVCLGCERVVIDSKWKKRSRLYINAYVVEDNQVQIVATGFSAKGIGQALIEYADDFGTISDRNYKLKRQGEGLRTAYTVYPRDISPFEFGDVEVRNLETVARYRTYDECVELIEGSNTKDLSSNSDW